jgi:two-component system chemotaxis response regulator CheB
MSSDILQTTQLGEITPFTCPDCGGVLSYMNADPVNRYRCYTGHTFTEEVLLQEQNRHIEEALWVAIRMMEERKNLLKATRRESREQVDPKQERAMALDRHISVLKKILKGDENEDNRHQQEF